MQQLLASFAQATVTSVRFVVMMSAPPKCHVNRNEQVKPGADADIVVYLEKESDSDLEPFLGGDDTTTRAVLPVCSAVEKVSIEVLVPGASDAAWYLEEHFHTADSIGDDIVEKTEAAASCLHPHN